MWAKENSIGDYEDEIFLTSCVAYLEDFLSFSGQRYEPDLDQKSKEEIFELVYDSVIFTLPARFTIGELLNHNFSSDRGSITPYENVQERFHLDSIGMSSFQDKFNIILVENILGEEKLIWRTISDMQIREVTLPAKCFEDVANQFLLCSYELKSQLKISDSWEKD
jgi:hypothetical protein